MSESALIKVRFYDPDVGYENLWTEKSGEDLYVIQSIRYFIYDISVGDVVRAEAVENGSVLALSRRVEGL